ncbi:MAG: hypothetical protein IPI67_17770 [Myxococcales bacterium]|nr:hypothetical protein [Myxococcales bacterium]
MLRRGWGPSQLGDGDRLVLAVTPDFDAELERFVTRSGDSDLACAWIDRDLGPQRL